MFSARRKKGQWLYVYIYLSLQNANFKLVCLFHCEIGLYILLLLKVDGGLAKPVVGVNVSRYIKYRELLLMLYHGHWLALAWLMNKTISRRKKDVFVANVSPCFKHHFALIVIAIDRKIEMGH
jgi:hypothetical protein